jgi:hypothetical protein
MVTTLEYPIPTFQTAVSAATGTPSDDPVRAYERRFGALPAWFDEVSRSLARSLSRQAIRSGVPLSAADHLG